VTVHLTRSESCAFALLHVVGEFISLSSVNHPHLTLVYFL